MPSSAAKRSKITSIMTEKDTVIIDLCSSPPPRTTSDQTPLRPVFCLKNREIIKTIDEREDCFILDFDPDDDTSDVLKILDKVVDDDASPDISVVAEKGHVACRDYPHSRHVCAKYPFTKTPHHTYCNMCYCFVCDVVAPCKKWTGVSGHCHAIDNEAWRLERKVKKKSRKISRA